MQRFGLQKAAVTVMAGAAIFGMAAQGAAVEAAPPSISAEQFVAAMAAHQRTLIDAYFHHHLNPNARARQDRPLLVAAILQQDRLTAGRLLEAGACVDLADERGLNPLMAAAMNGDVELVQKLLPLATNLAATDRNGWTALDYAITAGKTDAVEILLPTVRDLAHPAKDGRNAFALAVDGANPQVTDLLFKYLPAATQWDAAAMRVLEEAMVAGNNKAVRALLSTHTLPPVSPGKSVPLFAYALASHDLPSMRLLLECGADPNLTLPDKCDREFLALLPDELCDAISGDRGVTMLMLAAGLGQPESVKALLAAGADRKVATKRYKMLALHLAAQTGKWQCSQILLGSGPPPEQLHIEISLAQQQAAVIKDGVPVFSTTCSTGREGYATRTGDYVITDKERDHRSTIYHVDMPYFMRLSCLDFGMHEGSVRNHRASHGCIRLPGEAARKLFTEIPVGTLVTVK
jgi:ankyrin repeat protein